MAQRTLMLLATLALGAAAASADAQDYSRGRAKAAQCFPCHGPLGITPNPTFPNLAGQNPAYLGMQLHKFRSGERYDPIMTPIAQTLSDEDLHDLAAFFSELDLRLAARR